MYDLNSEYVGTVACTSGEGDLISVRTSGHCVTLKSVDEPDESWIDLDLEGVKELILLLNTAKEKVFGEA